MMMVSKLFYKILLVLLLAGVGFSQDSVKTIYDYPLRGTVQDNDVAFGGSAARDYYRFQMSSIKSYILGGEVFTDYVPKSTTLTLSGTTNQITVTGGTQNLGTDRTWTISLPGYILIDNGYDVTATTNSYRVGGTTVLGLTALGSTVVNSSLTSVGALNSGSITSGFGSINIGTSDNFTGGQIALFGTGTNLTTGDWKQAGIGRKFYASSYLGGYLGSGWIIKWDTTNGSYAEFDNVVIRNSLRTNIFQKDVVRATNGYLFISDVSTIAINSSTADATKYIYTSEDNFVSGDLLWYKDIDSTGAAITGIKISLTSNSTTVPLDSSNGNAYRYTYTVNSGSGTFQAGGTIVRVGSSVSTRRASIYMDASSGNAPFIDLYDGVSSWGEFQSADKVVSRIGNLGELADFAGSNLDSTIYGAYFRGNVLIGEVNSGSGIQLSTDASGGVYDTGFMLYDASNPKMFLGINGGASLDWNITTANTLTLKKAALTSPVIKSAETGYRVQIDTNAASGGLNPGVKFYDNSNYAYISTLTTDYSDMYFGTDGALDLTVTMDAYSLTLQETNPFIRLNQDVSSNGQIVFGNAGTPSTMDVNLFRDGANILRTNDNVDIDGNIYNSDIIKPAITVGGSSSSRTITIQADELNGDNISSYVYVTYWFSTNSAPNGADPGVSYTLNTPSETVGRNLSPTTISYSGLNNCTTNGSGTFTITIAGGGSTTRTIYLHCEIQGKIYSSGAITIQQYIP
jgi:hypothetical protein